MMNDRETTFIRGTLKDTNIDVMFAVKMMDAYLCSGDQDWAERLNDGRTEHFMLYQVDIFCVTSI